MLWQVEHPGHLLLGLGVGKIEIEFSQDAERRQFQGFPCRRKAITAVFGIVIMDEILLCPVQFLNQVAQVLCVAKLVDNQVLVGELTRAVLHGEVLDNERTQGNLQ